MFLLGAVIFDHTVLRRDDGATVASLRRLLNDLKAHGLKIGAFSTHDVKMDEEMSLRNLPPLDLFLTSSEVGENKGSGAWFAKAEEELNLARQQFLYVGDDKQDLITAINGGVVYLHAVWSKPKPIDRMVQAVYYPEQVMLFASHFMMQPPRWQYRFDSEGFAITLRSIMHKDTKLPATTQEMFGPHEVFQPRDREAPEIKNAAARVGEMLVLHALTSLQVEGLLEQGTFFSIFPSSTPGNVNPVLEKFVNISTKLFGYFRRDLLERMSQAPDTSKERTKATNMGSHFDVNFRIHSDTVRLNPKYKDSLKNRTVVLFDDFTTTGTSLEWGRNLLREAGAKNVILVTIGKYGSTHKIHVPTGRQKITPFKITQYRDDTFSIRTATLANDPGVAMRLDEMFEAWTIQQPYFRSHDVEE